MSRSSNQSTHSHSSPCSSPPLLCADSQLSAPEFPVSIPPGESGTRPRSGSIFSHQESSHLHNDSEDSHSPTRIDQAGLELSLDDLPDQIECPDSPPLDVYFAQTALQGVNESNDAISEDQVSVQATSSVLDSSSPPQESRDETRDVDEIQLNTESQSSPLEDTIDKHGRLEEKELSSDPSSKLESPFSSSEESTHGPLTHKVNERHSSSGSFPEQNLGSSTPNGTSKNEESPLISPRRRFALAKSAAQEEWEIEKNCRSAEGEEVCENQNIDALMELVGLEAVKAQFLAIKAKIDMFNDQEVELKAERFNVIFQGSPGTGKTTIARLFAGFMQEVGAISSGRVKETTGAKLAFKGPKRAKKLVKDGGILFVDEAYQLTAPYVSGSGRQALDVLLTGMETEIGRLIVIFAGYKEDMESFFEHNPGLASRIPYTLQFDNFSDAELWKIMCDNIEDKYKSGGMEVQDGIDGLYMHIAIRRLGLGRENKSFGNARAVENLLARFAERQALRYRKETREYNEKRKGREKPKKNFFTKEDLIGPDPTQAKFQSKAWKELQDLTGLESVKNAVKHLIGMIELNYRRELAELHPLRIPLNQVFVGSPGTGKTTVAKLYGQILVDLGLLSRGGVVLKNPSDFIGDAVGKSEANTRGILASTVGRVLVIDEAYMLHSGDGQSDSYRSGIIDTIVAEVQGTLGEDRCIIFVGYEDRIKDMFHHANPGLARRFPIENPFRFENFSITQLEEILKLKMEEQDLHASKEALQVARESLGRALLRPNFSNAGEVESMLTRAKFNYESRYSNMPVSERDFHVVLEPEDFDPDFNRGSSEASNCRGLLEGLVDHSIIQKLESYQKVSLAAQRRKLNPRDLIPTNFVFKGPPGTGKTTTALKMGNVFYSLGFLSTDTVISSSATDLVGQYVGQTAPKTRTQLAKALGKVLVIDEIHQLKGGHYATEAIDQIVQFLSQAEHSGRIVVILTGHAKDMNELMAAHPALSGLFSEEVMFENIKAENCITLLERHLAKQHVQASFLKDENSNGYKQVLDSFNAFSALPSWSNARDVQTVARRMIDIHIQNILQNHEQDDEEGFPPLPLETALSCLHQVFQTQADRSHEIQSSNSNKKAVDGISPTDPFTDPFQFPAIDFRRAPPPPAKHTDKSVQRTAGTTKIFIPVARVDSLTEQSPLTSFKGEEQQQQKRIVELDEEGKESEEEEEALSIDISEHDADDDDYEGYDSPHHPREVFREPNVSQERWNQLLLSAQARESQCAAETARLSALQHDSCIFRQKMLRLGGLLSEDEMRKWKEIEDEKKRLEDAKRTEKDVQRALRMHGPCPNGYHWSRVGDVWVCDGGMHEMSDSELRGFL